MGKMWEVKDKPMPKSPRERARWAKVTGWALRHPKGALLAPAATAAGLIEVGPFGVLGAAGATAAGLLAWRGAHPDSYDWLMAPKFRSWQRRWLSLAYLGKWWTDTMIACGFGMEDRRSAALAVPRVLKVRAHSPHVETVYVRYLKGQSPRVFTDRLPELAAALGAERVAIQPVRPMILALIVQRTESFTEVIPAPDMPTDTDMIDYGSVYLGETEYGSDWCEAVKGQHWLISGASGAGKGSITWDVLRGVAPAIRDGIVKPWGVDPKKIELSQGRPLFGDRYADDEEAGLALIQAFAADMSETQTKMADLKIRKAEPSAETPLNILMIDELAAVLAYGTPTMLRETNRLLALIASQGRATGHVIQGAVQEPTKSVVGIRDLFTLGICLRTTVAGHADMVLGEGARERGALTDEIPNEASTAGIGYRLGGRSRTPLRIRAAYTNDADIKELVEFVTGPATGERHLKSVA